MSDEEDLEKALTDLTPRLVRALRELAYADSVFAAFKEQGVGAHTVLSALKLTQSRVEELETELVKANRINRDLRKWRSVYFRHIARLGRERRTHATVAHC